MSRVDHIRAVLVELGVADEAWCVERARAKAVFPAKHPAAKVAHERYQTALLAVLNVARRLLDEKRKRDGMRGG